MSLDTQWVKITPMKKNNILEKIGLFFLKKAGWNIPKEIMKGVLTPIVLEKTNTVKLDTPPIIIEMTINKMKEDILNSAKKHIDISEKTTQTRKITTKLIIQKQT